MAGSDEDPSPTGADFTVLGILRADCLAASTSSSVFRVLLPTLAVPLRPGIPRSILYSVDQVMVLPKGRLRRRELGLISSGGVVVVCVVRVESQRWSEACWWSMVVPVSVRRVDRISVLLVIVKINIFIWFFVEEFGVWSLIIDSGKR